MSDLDGYEPKRLKQMLTTLRQNYERLEAELADLRTSSVVVRERCQECLGSNVELVTYKEPCPHCVDGWRLAEGVKPTAGRTHYIVPARLIEGDPDE